MDSNSLLDLRQQIDAIDQQILLLLNQRAHCAQAIALNKLANDSDTVFYRPEREAQVLRNVLQSSSGPLPNHEVLRLFREIMSACLAIEKPLSIACVGHSGSLHHQVALQHFGQSAQTVMMPHTDRLLSEVAKGSLDYGVVPLNNEEGFVASHLKRIAQHTLKICGDIVTSLPHYLLLKAPLGTANLETIYTVATKAEALQVWLMQYHSNIDMVVMPSLEAAIAQLNNTNAAAVLGSVITAERYNLHPSSTHILHTLQTIPTRFVIVGRHDIAASGDDQTLLLLSRVDKHYFDHTIQPLIQGHKVEIHALSHGETLDYLLNFGGHHSDAVLAETLGHLQQMIEKSYLLGTYPRHAAGYIR